MKRLGARARGAILRFFARWWAGILILALSLLALFTAYQMWKVGPILAFALLPQFILYLILIAVVVGVSRVVKALTSGEMMERGLSQGQRVLKGRVEEAKEALSLLGAEVRDDLARIAGGRSSQEPMVSGSAPRCPACGHFVRVGAKFCAHCGTPLPVSCPHCGRSLRPEARFCDGCGKPLRPGA